MLVLLDKLQWNVNLGIAPTMLTVLGVGRYISRLYYNASKLTHLAPLSLSLTHLQTVLGFCISYRTSSSYERFIEGRKLWQQVHVATRLASRLIWFHCPTQCGLDVEEENKDADAAKALLEKKVSSPACSFHLFWRY
jgi:putative membrane protein